jgi:hypothetical protein
MNAHPDLVALLRGELSNADITEVGDHLNRCEECRQELAETAVGHALLIGTTRTLSHSARLELPAVPPPKSPTSSPRGRTWLRPLGLVAAAAALVVGTALVTQWADRPTATRTAVAAPERIADLEPVEGTGSGRVVMAKGSHDGVRMTVETRGLPKIGQGQFYEVWLFNPKTQKMVPVGVLGPGGKASLEVPDSLVDSYQDVDVSLERDDGDPGHSATSVLRAKYT